ncbi:MAG: hypothetical protein KGL59_02800 [Acidobacteriota bacterium]|nr:hypothetical protein [Acidobacteriota bacterium]
MKFAATFTFIALALALAPGQGQTKPQTQNPGQGAGITRDPHFRLMYQDDDMMILDVIIPPHQSTQLDEYDNNYLLVNFGQSTLTAQDAGQPPLQLVLPDGAVRFGEGGISQTLTNDGDLEFHALAIVFLNQRLTAKGCSCDGGAADAVCSCPNAQPLPGNWSQRIGQVELQGVTLPPGATYDNTSTRTTRFLVALTPFDMLDSTIHEPKNLEIRLPEGWYQWLSPGPHKIQNLSSGPMRFVSVEFYGTPKKDD